MRLTQKIHIFGRLVRFRKTLCLIPKCQSLICESFFFSFLLFIELFEIHSLFICFHFQIDKMFSWILCPIRACTRHHPLMIYFKRKLCISFFFCILTKYRKDFLRITIALCFCHVFMPSKHFIGIILPILFYIFFFPSLFSTFYLFLFNYQQSCIKYVLEKRVFRNNFFNTF